jgi:hypothetical protein
LRVVFRPLFNIISNAAAQRSVAAGRTEKLAVITLVRRLFKILVLFAVVLLLLSGGSTRFLFEVAETPVFQVLPGVPSCQAD